MAESRRGRPSTGVREAVLQSTQEVLGEAGIALSTKEIARRAGVAESSIFYHFGDRLGLLQAVIGLHLPVFSDATVVLGGRKPGDGAGEREGEREGPVDTAGPGDPADSAGPSGPSGRSGPSGPSDELAALLSGLEDFYLGIMPILGALQSDRQLRDLLAERGGEIGPHLALRPVADRLRAERDAGRLPATADPRAGALLLIGAAHQRALHRYLLGSAVARFLPAVGDVVRTLLPAFAGRDASGT